MRARTIERIEWLLKKIAATHFNGMCAWNEEVADDFVEAFPEAEKSLIYYMLGPNSNPMLNRSAGQAHKLGYLRAGSVGNMRMGMKPKQALTKPVRPYTKSSMEMNT